VFTQHNIITLPKAASGTLEKKYSRIACVMAGRVFRPLCIFAVLFVIFWMIGLAVHPSCSSEHLLNISFANTNFHVVYRC
jgi:hypothetical protein